MNTITSMINREKREENSVMCIMCFIPIARGNFVQSSIQQLCTPALITFKNTVRWLNYFLQ